MLSKSSISFLEGMEFQRVTHDGGLALVRTRKAFPVLWPLGQQKAKRITFLSMSLHLEFCVFTSVMEWERRQN